MRKGIAVAWGITGGGKNKSLHEKKDKERMEALLEPYEPYRSVACYYLWKWADTKDFTIYSLSPSEQKN